METEIKNQKEMSENSSNPVDSSVIAVDNGEDEVVLKNDNSNNNVCESKVDKDDTVIDVKCDDELLMETEIKNQKEMSENSSNPVDSSVIAVDNGEDEVVLKNDNSNNNVCESKVDKDDTVIDVKCDDEVVKGKENWDGTGEKVCRICHLNGRDGPVESLDLIQLGCGCKDELGIAHQHCGEAWFRMKGNRCCEICGEAAKNITGIGDYRFMEEWNENSGGDIASVELRRGFFRGQPVCNFLMACLVIAFVVPWFFHVNMF